MFIRVLPKILGLKSCGRTRDAVRVKLRTAPPGDLAPTCRRSGGEVAGDEITESANGIARVTNK